MFVITVAVEEFPYSFLEASMATVVGTGHSSCVAKVCTIKVARIDIDSFDGLAFIFGSRCKGRLGCCAYVAGKGDLVPRVDWSAQVHPIREVGSTMRKEEHAKTPGSSSLFIVPLITAGVGRVSPIPLTRLR